LSTKKDFQLTADIIRDCSERTPNQTPREQIIYRALAIRFAEEYAKQNPRFDRSRFFAACGVKP